MIQYPEAIRDAKSLTKTVFSPVA